MLLPLGAAMVFPGSAFADFFKTTQLILNVDATGGAAVASSPSARVGKVGAQGRLRLTLPSLASPLARTGSVEWGNVGASLRAEGSVLSKEGELSLSGTHDVRVGDAEAIVVSSNRDDADFIAQAALGALSFRSTRNQTEGRVETGVNVAPLKVFFKSVSDAGDGVCASLKALSVTQGLASRTIHPFEGELCGFVSVGESVRLKDTISFDLANPDGRTLLGAQGTKISNRASVTVGDRWLRTPVTFEHEVSRTSEGGRTEWINAVNAGLVF